MREPRKDSADIKESLRGISHLPFINELANYIPGNASILELGCGPGNDTLILQRQFRVVSTDIKLPSSESSHFSVEFADARDILTPGPFQGIYSAKLLQLFSPGDLERSAESQASKLGKNGILAHLVWNPERIGNNSNLLNYHDLRGVFEKYGSVEFEATYTTHIENDTIGFIIQT